MIGNLLQVNSASDALAVVLNSFERSTHLGLGLAVGLAVAVKAYEVLSAQIAATDKAEKELDADITRPKNLVFALTGGDLQKEAERLQKDLAEAQKQEGTKTQAVADFLKFGLTNIMVSWFFHRNR